MRKLRNGGYVNVSKRRDYSSNLSFVMFFGLFYLVCTCFIHPEEISTPYLGDVCFCKSMFQQTDGDIDEIIVPIASFDPASTVEVRANAHVSMPATSTMCSRCFMKSVRLVFLASGFRNSSTRQA